jgi:hypothetical protein
MKTKNKWYISIWSEGKYIDFWFFNHFFSGFLFASFLIFLEIPHWINFVLLISFAILWEIYEYKNEVREIISNKIIDLLVGLFGFLFMYLLVGLGIFDFNILFMGTFILLAILEVWGYLAYKANKK